MKHGLSMEQMLKKGYATISKKLHEDLKMSDSGFVIYEELSCIAVSPDLKVECKCCDADLVEIICPLIRGGIPSADNLGFLQNMITSDNQVTRDPMYLTILRNMKRKQL